MSEIETYEKTILGIYRSYCKKPEWYKIQLLLQNTLKLGMLLGREQLLQQQEAFKKKDNVPINRKETDTFEILEEIKSKGEFVLECSTKREAMKYRDRIRSYAKYEGTRVRTSIDKNKILRIYLEKGECS